MDKNRKTIPTIQANEYIIVMMLLTARIFESAVLALVEK